MINHIQAVLRNVALVEIRAFSAARPTSEELRLRAKRTAAPEVIANATSRRAQFVERQSLVASLLNAAAADIRSLRELLGADGRPGQKLFRAIIGAVRRVLPFAWAGFVVTQFDALSGAPQWQLFAFAAVATAAYHGFAWLTLPFHDSAYRQFILFEGGLGDASNGIPSIYPKVSRHEKALFRILSSRPPVVVSWEDFVPPIQYLVISFLLIAMLIKLPFDQIARYVAGALTAVLICWYARQIVLWWRLIRMRYSDHSITEIIWALLWGTYSLFREEGTSEKDETAAEPSNGDSD